MRGERARVQYNTTHMRGRGAAGCSNLSLSASVELPSLDSRCNSQLPVAGRFAVGVGRGRESRPDRASCCSGRVGQARLLMSRLAGVSVGPTDVCVLLYESALRPRNHSITFGKKVRKRREDRRRVDDASCAKRANSVEITGETGRGRQLRGRL